MEKDDIRWRIIVFDVESWLLCKNYDIEWRMIMFDGALWHLMLFKGK